MRDGWVETTLGEIADINPEKTPKWPDDHLIRYVDIASVSWGSPISPAIQPQLFGEAPGRARRLIRSGDVIASTVRPNLRAFAVVPPDLDGEVASTGFAVLRAKPKHAIPSFIWALVSHESFRDDMVLKATGSNYPAVRPPDVASHKVALPPIAEQRRIVDLVGALDDAIAAGRESTLVARQAAAALRRSSFGQAAASTDPIPAGEMFDMLLGRQKSPRQSVGDHVIPYLRAGNISSDGFLLSDLRTMNFSPDEQAKYCLHDDDVMLVEGGSLGQSSMWSGQVSGPIGFDKHVIRLRAIEGRSTAQYALQWTRWAYETGAFAAQATGATIRALGFGRASAMSVPGLSLEQQKSLVRPLAAADDVVLGLRSEASRMQDLRSNLLAALLSGEHEIPESYDAMLAG